MKINVQTRLATTCLAIGDLLPVNLSCWDLREKVMAIIINCSIDRSRRKKVLGKRARFLATYYQTVLNKLVSYLFICFHTKKRAYNLWINRKGFKNDIPWISKGWKNYVLPRNPRRIENEQKHKRVFHLFNIFRPCGISRQNAWC